jgi:hypothetical protein
MLKQKGLGADPLTLLEKGIIQGSRYIIYSHELSTRETATYELARVEDRRSADFNAGSRDTEQTFNPQTAIKS